MANAEYRYPFCDVFIMKERKKRYFYNPCHHFHTGPRYVLCDKAGQATWPQESYSRSQVDQRTWRHFGDTRLPCPRDPEEYLSR